MADQHDPSEPQDEPRRSGLPRQPEPRDRDPWAPPAQRVVMDEAATDEGAADPSPANEAADRAVGVGERDTSAPRPPAA
ncbi:hypothetical protein JBE04_34745, partial [Streptomyces sp. PRKS01-29]